MELNPTAKVILGLLSHGPRSGYDIKRMVDRSTRFFWAASYGQIYPELRRLEDDGLIEGSAEPRGERKRTVFTLTGSGEEALRQWLRGPSEVLELRNEGLLKLFFAGCLSPEEAVGRLHALRDQHSRLADDLRAIDQASISDEGQFPELTLRFGIELHDWVAGWCERVEAELPTGAAGAPRA